MLDLAVGEGDVDARGAQYTETAFGFYRIAILTIALQVGELLVEALHAFSIQIVLIQKL